MYIICVYVSRVSVCERERDIYVYVSIERSFIRKMLDNGVLEFRV